MNSGAHIPAPCSDASYVVTETTRGPGDWARVVFYDLAGTRYQVFVARAVLATGDIGDVIRARLGGRRASRCAS